MTPAAGGAVPDCLGLITARRGSRGLPDKHLRLLGGRPLIAWTFEAAQSSRTLTRRVLSTDDERLIVQAERAGIEAPFRRPVELAADDTPHLEVVRHALEWHRSETGGLPNLLVLLQPTSPFRTGEDIDEAVTLAVERGQPVVGVTECEHHPARCYRIARGGLQPYDRRAREKRRQDLPPIYRVNGAIYVARPEALLESGQFVPRGAVPFVMPIWRSVDIDTEVDLAWAEFCLASQRTNREARTGP